MGETGRLSRHRAQAKAESRVEARRPDTPVVETDLFALPVFEKQFPIVVGAQRVTHDARSGVLIEG